MIQSEFLFREPKPKSSSHELNALIAILRGKKEWITARELAEKLKLTNRKIRDLASQSDGLILSGPGCPGYKHILDAEPHEIAEVCARLKHQADAMISRSIQIRSAYHKAPYKS